MTSTDDQTDTRELLDRTGRGDPEARQALLVRHRGRLKRMVEVRLDARLASRIDPSDVAQDALLDAAGRLDDYVRERPIPFYPWLRQFAWERLVKLHEKHLGARKRSVSREQGQPHSDGSAVLLADRLMGSMTSPSRRLLRDEQRALVRAALGRLAPRDREVLELRYLEGLSNAEAAAALGIGEGALKMRHLRALERLRVALGFDDGEQP